MMKKNKLIYLLLGFMFAFVACDEPGSEILFSESFVELDAAGTSSGTETYSFLRVNNGINLPSGFTLNLASKPLDQAVNVTFEVVAATTTAIENVHYVLNGTSVTIPAGGSIVQLPIDIIVDGINPGEQWDIDIRIVSADVRIEESLSQAVHTVQITCPSALEGSYNFVSTATAGSPGFWSSAGVMTLTRTGPVSYELSDFAVGAFGPPQPMAVDDTCDAITEGSPGQGLGSIVSGSVGAGGVITLDMILTCCGGNDGDTWTIVMTPQ